MKKIIAVLSALFILTSCVFALELTYDGETREYTGPNVSLVINENNFTPSEGQMPSVIIDDRTLVPVREVFELLGGTVNWNAEDKKVSVSIDNNSVELTINNNVAIVNGEEKQLDVPAKIINNKTMVPVRFISENCGLKVEWNGESKTVFISKPAEILDEDQDDKIEIKEPVKEEEPPVIVDGKPVQLLDVEGMRVNLAKIMLGYDNLLVKTIYENSNDVPADTVIRQSPTPNSTVFEGTTITLYVSSGKENIVEPSKPVIDIPTPVVPVPVVELEKTFEDIPEPSDLPLAISRFNEKYSKLFGEDKGKNATYQLIDLIITNNLNGDHTITIVYQDGYQKIFDDVSGIYDIKSDVMSIFTGRFSIYGRYDDAGYINKIIITRIG